jgi:plastocyanin
MQWWAALCCIGTMLWVAGLGDVGRSAAGTTTPTVAIDGVTFTPATLTVTVGDTVVWVNKDPFPHTVTSPAGAFDSHTMAPGQSWRYTPIKAGVFPYVCTLHPTMQATLTVE